MPVTKGNEPEATTGAAPVFTATPTGTLVGRGLRVVAESRVPGGSQLLDGKLKSGVFHLAAGVLARSLFGGIGVALVAANSYSKSTSGKGLIKRVKGA